ncbi:hypothetical protein SLEP1_g31596 [Rubroshorea leprosula]|uniref:DNA repair metallo-beta-lactamase domain-containing protein n=1 Tax=Rubroshorea leprosula TaxID=152421 RepID=A0AAV5K9H8_9ROSI|nr:hypothetical protein SLEP1_g31596 [Rubroshorea leprosula]
MPIEMPKGLPFSVDTFSPSSKRKRHHFLTHAHKDHTAGISTHSSYPIYATRLTKTLVLQQYPQLDDSLFVGIEVGQSILFDDPDGEFTVTAFDANHCPGAVMFLFEGNFGNILHTGDCRLTPECLQSLPEKFTGSKKKEPSCRLDYIFLDCTFGRFSQRMPSKHSAIHQVINCIWNHPDAPVVYLTCDLLGQEEILANVSRTFGSKIFVDKAENQDFFQILAHVVPEILSEDSSSHFRLFDGFPKLYERAAAKLAEAQANSQPEPLIIRPSAQWYACGEEHSETGSQKKLKFNEAMRDQFGVWHVCYSTHSSREELEWALQLLAPKRVVSTTPGCWAMELNYVKKNCFSSTVVSDDPLWKLLKINVEASAEVDASATCSPMVEEPTQTSEEPKLLPVKISSPHKKLLGLSPPSKRPPVTLFGRARFGVLVPNLVDEERIISKENGIPHGTVDEPKQESAIQEETKERHEKSEDELEVDVTGVQREKLTRKRTYSFSSNVTIGSSKSYSNGIRRLYRSLNVPVPKPLPSLVELMNNNKRARKIEF